MSGLAPAVLLACLVVAALGATVLVRRGLARGPRPLSARITAFEAESGLTPPGSVAQLWESAALAASGVSGEPPARLACDLAVTGRTSVRYALDRLGAGMVGATCAVGLLVFWRSSGLSFGPLASVAVVAAAGSAFFTLPALQLRREADRRRAEFRSGLTACMELVGVTMAGGAGLNTALDDATAAGDTWVFAWLRRSIAEAHLRGISPWEAFERLGDRLGVPQLVELGAAMTMAGASGAPIGDTLRARVVTARARAFADEMEAAERASQRLGVPVAMLLMGWVGFLGYPAVVALLGT